MEVLLALLFGLVLFVVVFLSYILPAKREHDREQAAKLARKHASDWVIKARAEAYEKAFGNREYQLAIVNSHFHKYPRVASELLPGEMSSPIQYAGLYYGTHIPRAGSELTDHGDYNPKNEQDLKNFQNPEVKKAWEALVPATVKALVESLPASVFMPKDPSNLHILTTGGLDSEHLLQSVEPHFKRMSELTTYQKPHQAIFTALHNRPRDTPPKLDGTLFQNLGHITHLPAFIPISTRMEHHWLIGGSGHGKTTAIQHIIAEDIPDLLKGRCSIVVIDNQKQMIPKLANLKIWSEHPQRLTHLAPWEIKHPIALNFFKVDMPEDEQAAFEEMLAIMASHRFILDTLLEDATLTGKQGNVFDALLMLMLQIPNSTMTTYLELLTPEGFAKYKDEYVPKLNPKTRDFFNRDYMPTGKGVIDQYKTTREEVRRRLQQLVINPLFEGMFCQPDLHLDLLGDMQAGTMVLIDTDKDKLKDISQMVTALFMGILYQAIMARDPNADNIPCYVILDECYEHFLYTAPMLEELLVQARKRGVGLLLAHQSLSQIERVRGLHGALDSSTSIKMAGGLGPNDAKALADTFETTPEILRNPGGKGIFVTTVRNLTADGNPATFHSTLNLIEDMPQMTPSQYNGMRERMRKKYSADLSKVQPPPPPPPEQPTAEKETADW